MNKYKILKDQYIEAVGKKLYRIQALKDFNGVKAGDTGGYIENESNLSQSDNAWVCDNAQVYGNARVYGTRHYLNLGPIWYIVESYYDHDLIMTDGTHFNDENKYAKVSKRFYCNRPTIPAPQWIRVEERLPEEQKEVLIYLPEYDSVEMAALFTIPSMNLREWAQNEDAYMLNEVSYWMPLPEPPKEVRDDGAHIEP